MFTSLQLTRIAAEILWGPQLVQISQEPEIIAKHHVRRHVTHASQQTKAHDAQHMLYKAEATMQKR